MGLKPTDRDCDRDRALAFPLAGRHGRDPRPQLESLMPNITIVIPGDFLTQPAVALAFANLALALGGHDGEQAAQVPIVVDVTAYAATSAAPDHGGASDANAAPAPRADHVAAPAAVAAAGDDVLRARWDTYTAGLTDNARKFLALLEKRGRLTILEAIKLLGLPGKAVGGIVGPIGRWTPKHGFAVPFSVNENANGVRFWVWTGVAGASATETESESAPVQAAPVPVISAIPADHDLRARWVVHVAGLAENARKFLALLETRGRMTQDEAVALLDLPGGKALGGVVGSIGRWTPAAGFKVPYNAEGARGTRSGLWTGVAAV